MRIRDWYLNRPKGIKKRKQLIAFAFLWFYLFYFIYDDVLRRHVSLFHDDILDLSGLLGV